MPTCTRRSSAFLASLFVSIVAMPLGAASFTTTTESDDPDRIAELSAKAAQGDYVVRQAAIESLRNDHGAYAVDGLLRWAGSGADVDQRVQAVYALRRLEGDAALALAAALDSDDDMVRRNACMALEAMQDPRTIASLTLVAETDTDALTREQAAGALGGTSSRRGAVEALVDLSRRFRSGEAGTGSAVFFWNGKGVGNREVSENVYGPAYAKLFAEDAVALDPSSEEAQNELVAAYSDLAAALSDSGSGFDESEVDAIQNLVHMGGNLGVAAAEDTVVRLVEQPMAGASDLIHSDDKRLRYKAALSLWGTDSSRHVVETLADALSESATRHAVVIDANVEEQNGLVAILTGRDSEAVGASTGAMGLMRAKASPPKDVIVIRTGLPDLAADKLVGNLSRDVRTQDVPVIVIANESEVGRVRAELGDRVVMVIPAPATAAVIQPALEAAYESAVLNDQRMEAEQFAQNAAAALSHLNRDSLAPAAPALVAAIGRDDSVQINALKALGTLGDGAAQEGAASVFANATQSEGARLAAAQALAGILARNPMLPQTETALLAALAGDNQNLRRAAAMALGSAMSMSTGERSQLLLKNGLGY